MGTLLRRAVFVLAVGLISTGTVGIGIALACPPPPPEEHTIAVVENCAQSSSEFDYTVNYSGDSSYQWQYAKNAGDLKWNKWTTATDSALSTSRNGTSGKLLFVRLTNHTSIMDSATPNGELCSTPTPEPKKVYVCKYVGTPGVDERLQTGQNPIEVSVNAIPEDPVVVGSYFADAQGRSYVLGFVPMDPEPTAADCPPGETPSPSPSVSESPSPSESPSASPSESPSASPSESPSASPSESPSNPPSNPPSASPSAKSTPPATGTTLPPLPKDPLGLLAWSMFIFALGWALLAMLHVDSRRRSITAQA
jgi:hypothetical protein